MKFIKKIAKSLLNTLKKIWIFYNKKIRFFQTIDYRDVDTSLILPKDADRTVKACCRLLAALKVPYAVSSGTALGIYRNKKLIAHDNDIDFDIWDCEDTAPIISRFAEIGLQLARKVLYKGKIQQLVFTSDEPGMLVDLLFYRRKWSNFVNYAEPGYVLKLPPGLCNNVEILEWEGTPIAFHGPAEKYIETMYGADWRTPRKSKGDWKDDCHIIYKKWDPIFWTVKALAPLHQKMKKMTGGAEIPEEFFASNKKIWAPLPDYANEFLVDLTLHDHEFYVVNLISARALCEVVQAKPVVLLVSRLRGEVRRLVESFDIKNIIYLDDYHVSFFKKIKIACAALWLWLTIVKSKNVLGATYKGIVIGHYFYDDFLKITGLGTVKPSDPRLISILYRSLFVFERYEMIFAQRKYSLFFGIEQAYLNCGIPCAIAIKNNIKVVLRKHAPNKVTYKFYTTSSDLDNFPTHPELLVFEEQMRHPEKALEWSSKYIGDLFRGTVDAFDWNAKNAYETAAHLSGPAKEKLFAGKFKYKVFIFTHVLVDAPHCYRQALYPDYEIWLRETLKIASQRKDCLWIIKPHPSDKFYQLKTTAAGIYNDFKQYDNIRLFPANIQTADLVGEIDAAVTVRGTAAIEYSCVGVPVITAGRSTFDEGQFCLTPLTIAEYKDTLLHHEFSRLPEEVIKRAKVYLYVYNILNTTPLPLLSDIMLASPWSATAQELYTHLLKKYAQIQGAFTFPEAFIQFIKQRDNPHNS